MGGGRWSDDDWAGYSSTHIKGKSTAAIYGKSKMDDDLNPKGVTVRESRDSDDNPESTAIIVALDVTGSMSPVLDSVARKGLNTLATEIYERKPVTDPHIMFMGVGDVKYDRSPLQATQFEADIRIAEQLQKIWLEQGGGGNDTESYNLPWYFAAMHTSIDCFEKRGKKGYLFTVGDEFPPDALLRDQIETILGSSIEKDISNEDLLTMVQRTYHVFHVIIEQGWCASRQLDKVSHEWKKTLGQRVLSLSDATNLSEVIVSAIQLNEGVEKDKIIESWDGSTSLVVKNAIKDLTDTASEESGIVNL